MAERDARLERFVNGWLASVVTAKIEGFLKEKREEIVERYGTDKPHIDVVREKLHQQQPSQIVNPIDVALELRDAIEAVRRRSFLLPLAMFHIGALFSYFEVCLKERDVPTSLKESYRRMAAAEDGLRAHEERQKKIEEVLAEPIIIIRTSYEEDDEATQDIITDWLLGVYPTLIDDIVEAMNPRTIRKKKPDEWTADDKRYYARKRLMKEVTRIAREYGRPVFGDPGVKKSKS
jgi:hypothetical protein